jgi:predicted phosphoribosyltransferase
MDCLYNSLEINMNFAREQAIFENRHDAGKQLATELREYENQSVVVLAIPNGGVPVALGVAGAIEADFDLIICRKIPMPLNPEAGFGAIADDGTVILNEEIVKRIGLNRQQIDHEASKVRAEIKRRSMLYKGNRPLVSLRSRTVIIIDDGVASGVTMMAAVASVRHRRPKQIVVAAPCAWALAVKQLERVADKVVTCTMGFMPEFAVGDFYRHWYDLSDDEVIRYISQWRSRYLHRY